jgi:excisionase family DNA binding protein
VTPEFVYRLIRSGDLPGVHLGRQVRVEEAALQRWVADRAAPRQADSNANDGL